MKPDAEPDAAIRASGKQEYIDTLRGVAALMVILVHTAQTADNLSPWISEAVRFGQLGVQLFFVASAYTMCMTFKKRSHEPLPVRSFYLRRFFRIAPLYYFAILLYYAVFVVVFERGTPSFSPPFTVFNILANVLFVHGFVPSANNSVVPGGWSIGTEMAFYLLFPLLFALSTRWKDQLAKMVLALSAAMAINLGGQILIAGSAPAGLENNSFMYFNLWNQLPVFLVGIIGFWLNEGPSAKVTSKWVEVLGFLFFGAISAFLWSSQHRFSFVFLPTVSGVAFLFLLNLLRRENSHSRVLCRIGQVSYSMYVFHFVFAWTALGFVLKRLPFEAPPNVALLVSFPVVAGCSFLAARLTERLIERRGIALGNLLIARMHRRSADSRTTRAAGPLPPHGL